MTRQVVIPKPLNRAEETLALQLRIATIPFEREYKFAPPRKFRADFALLEHKLLIEIQGGAYNYGRHNRPKGFISDMEKFRLAATLGFHVLCYPTDDVIKGKAIREIADIILKRQHGY